MGRGDSCAVGSHLYLVTNRGKRGQEMSTLAKTRELDGATLQDEEGRYYRQEGERKRYGYHAHFTGAYVCYTCGVLCECGEE